MFSFFDDEQFVDDRIGDLIQASFEASTAPSAILLKSWIDFFAISRASVKLFDNSYHRRKFSKFFPRHRMSRPQFMSPSALLWGVMITLSISHRGLSADSGSFVKTSSTAPISF